MTGRTPDNLLLTSLSPSSRDSLLTRLKPVSLRSGTMLYSAEETPKHAHFITAGIASIGYSSPMGEAAEVGIWGCEGLVESFHLLGRARYPYACAIRMETTALAMPFAELQREFRRNDELRDLILQCVQSQSIIMGQLAICNQLHDADKRLARWLLMLRDRVESDLYPLTQDFLAAILGLRRTTVTSIAGEFQRKGLIEYSRGKLQITHAPGLQKIACECYGLIRQQYANFYGRPKSTGSAND